MHEHIPLYAGESILSWRENFLIFFIKRRSCYLRFVSASDSSFSISSILCKIDFNAKHVYLNDCNVSRLNFDTVWIKLIKGVVFSIRYMYA